MKKAIISIIIILIMMQTALAQQCTEFNDITITIQADTSPQFSDTPTGANGNEQTELPPEKISMSINENTITWYDQCDPEKIEESYYGFDWYTDAGFSTNDAYQGRAEVTAPTEEGPVMYYAYTDTVTGTFKVIQVLDDGTINGKEYSHDTNALRATSITTNSDGSAVYVAGRYVSGGTGDSFIIKINSDLSAVWAYRYDMTGVTDYDVFNDIKFDVNGYIIALGMAAITEFMEWHTLVTANTVNGDLIDYKQITSAQAEAAYTNQKLVLKTSEGQDTTAYIATMDKDEIYNDDVLYGSFTIDKDDASISAKNFLKLLSSNSGAFLANELVHATLSADNDLDLTVNLYESGDPGKTYCTIARINGATGSVEIVRGIAIDDTTCGPQKEYNGKAFFASSPSILAILNSDNTLTLKNLDSVSKDIYFSQMAYGDNYYYAAFFTGDFTAGITKINLNLDDVIASNEITMIDDIAYYPYSIYYHPSVSMLLQARNQGGGFQNFGITSPIGGDVPEFSLTTLLLATLLAGGLVLFVVRRRK